MLVDTIRRGCMVAHVGPLAFPTRSHATVRQVHGRVDLIRRVRGREEQLPGG